MLGFSSEFKVRQLEKQGRLRPFRGAMGQAWYPRSQVVGVAETLALRRTSALPGPGSAGPGSAGLGLAGLGLDGSIMAAASGRWSDAALIAHLRIPAASEENASPRPRTVVDLVADTGVSIARAERIYRFWLAHDVHPVAQRVRNSRGPNGAAGGKRGPALGPTAVPDGTQAGAVVVGQAGPPSERRGDERIERDTLIRQLRHADPTIRARAFQKLEKLRRRRGPA